MVQTTHFNKILEMIDNLSLEEQQDLMGIIQHRQIEQRQEEIARNIAQAKEEYQQGQVFRGMVDNVIKELSS